MAKGNRNQGQQFKKPKDSTTSTFTSDKCAKIISGLRDPEAPKQMTSKEKRARNLRRALGEAAELTPANSDDPPPLALVDTMTDPDGDLDHVNVYDPNGIQDAHDEETDAAPIRTLPTRTMQPRRFSGGGKGRR